MMYASTQVWNEISCTHSPKSNLRCSQHSGDGEPPKSCTMFPTTCVFANSVHLSTQHSWSPPSMPNHEAADRKSTLVMLDNNQNPLLVAGSQHICWSYSFSCVGSAIRTEITRGFFANCQELPLICCHLTSSLSTRSSCNCSDPIPINHTYVSPKIDTYGEPYFRKLS
jgi:hypothetical protein